jgi:uncharacterized protein YbaR (Trm112 family)
MKPWLFDILACPIDKSYPLKLYIFKYETPLVQFESFLRIYNDRDIDQIKRERIIEIDETPDGDLIKDGIALKNTPLEDYLTLIIQSIDELDNIYDKSDLSLSSKCFDLLTSEVKEKIIKFSEKEEIPDLDDILPELYFINKIKLDVEIETGLLFCEHCYRWFPIIDTIPQMLPDEYRNKDNDLDFLKNHKNLCDPEFFQQNLKPFNL